METASSYLLQYRSSVYIDGYTYQLSLRFPSGRREFSGELTHSHAQYELHAFFQGGATLQLEGQPELTLRPGDCCIIPPHLYHLRRLGPGAVKCCVLSIGCPKGAPLRLHRGGCIRLRCAPAILGYLSALEGEFSDRRIGSDGSIQSLFTLLMTAILRELTALPQEPPQSRRTPVRQREDMIDNYFARHYWYDISAQDLADRIGVTTRQLARIMQQRYGCTFRQHLLEIRLYHARQQLTDTDQPIWQIATACGFTCQGAFATAFRKHVGCTPSQYRRQRGGKV